MHKGKQLRHSEAPRSYQRGDGSREQHRPSHNALPFGGRSIAWLKDARLRDDAVDVREG